MRAVAHEEIAGREAAGVAAARSRDLDLLCEAREIGELLVLAVELDALEAAGRARGVIHRDDDGLGGLVVVDADGLVERGRDRREGERGRGTVVDGIVDVRNAVAVVVARAFVAVDHAVLIRVLVRRLGVGDHEAAAGASARGAAAGAAACGAAPAPAAAAAAAGRTAEARAGSAARVVRRAAHRSCSPAQAEQGRAREGEEGECLHPRESILTLASARRTHFPRARLDPRQLGMPRTVA